MPIDLGKKQVKLQVGGPGSGRTEWDYPNSKTEVEECDTISSTDWYDRGLIWEGLNRKQFSITVGEEKTDYDVRIEWVECNFGGARPYFICPEKNCDRRVEKLYRPKRQQHYVCRHCWDLTYKRCNISGQPRKIKGHRLEKIREKLRKKSKRDNYEIGLYPSKPKDMHWDTFLEIEEEYLQLQKEYIRDAGESMVERSRNILESVKKS